MSDPQAVTVQKIRMLPLIIKKDSIRSQKYSNNEFMFRYLKASSGNFVVKEDLIYKATDGDFFKGKYPNLVITNKLNVLKNNSQTTATYSSSGSTVELTSDTVVNIIGQENYDTVLTALCSVINQDLKVRGILALLCNKKFATNETQTYESSHDILVKEKLRRRRRSKVTSYVVKNQLKKSPKKLVVNPAEIAIKCEDIKLELDENKIDFDNNHSSCNITNGKFFNNDKFDTKPLSNMKNESSSIKLDVNQKVDKSSKTINIKVDINERNTEFIHRTDTKTDDVDSNSSNRDISNNNTDHFPELKKIVDEDSNISDAESIGNISLPSSIGIPNIEYNANTILNYIDEHIEEAESQSEVVNTTIMTVDGSFVTVRGNPDEFHLATPDILNDLQPRDQKKLLLHQAYIDWKYCLQRDEDGNLPIHIAVLNNDMPLLLRQCLVLKSRNESVDIAAAGNLTALQISLYQDSPDCTTLLLNHGADVLVRDEEGRTPLHLAAEHNHRHLEVILTHCRQNARQILLENEEFQRPNMKTRSDSENTQYLLDKICTLYDTQGNTPLLLASKLGNFEAVNMLVAASPSTINMAMPTSGNNALYEAVVAAYLDASHRGDKTKIIDKFKKTIKVLTENGSDPYKSNNAGSTVIDLLTEFNIVSLSMLVGNNLSLIKSFVGDQLKTSTEKKVGSYMLVKDKMGKVKIEDIKVRTQEQNKDKRKTFKEDKIISANSKIAQNTSKVHNNVNEEVKSSEKTLDSPNAAKDLKTIHKPLILKNVPVITKILTFDKSNKSKTVLAKNIASTVQAGNVGLKTKLVPPKNPPVIRLDSDSKIKPNVLKIILQPESDIKTNVEKSESSVTKSCTNASKIDVRKSNIVIPKRKYNILNSTPAKKSKTDYSEPSTSKISKP